MEPNLEELVTLVNKKTGETIKVKRAELPKYGKPVTYNSKYDMAQQIVGGGVPFADIQKDPTLMALQAQQVASGNTQNVLSGDEKKEQAKLDKVSQAVELLEKNLGQAEATGPLLGRGAMWGNAVSGGGLAPEVADYEALRKSLIGPLARAISGEVGVLTDKDIERAEGLLPKITDAKKLRENKLKNLAEVISKRSFKTTPKASTQGKFTIEAIE